MRVDSSGDIFVVDIEEKNGKTEVRLAQCLDPVLKRVKELREDSDRGFTRDRGRNWQMVGSIPTIFWKREWETDPDGAMKWLETDPVGQQYRIAPKNTGRTGQIIVR